jgi:hypothetical protein
VGQAQATLLKHILFAFMDWGLLKSRGIKEMLAYQPLERFKGCLWHLDFGLLALQP